MAHRRSPYISKTKYLEGLQCPKLLWFEFNARDKVPPPDIKTKWVFEEGRRVGELARSIYPGGILVERRSDPKKTHLNSVAKIKEGKPLFEAGFVFENAYALADILLPAPGGAWDIIEVKSSTEVKDQHFHDVSFQKYVYQGAGLKIRKCFVMVINNKFVKSGPIDPQKLFRSVDVTEAAEELLSSVPGNLKAMFSVISQKTAPDIKINSRCRSPHECPLLSFCSSGLPEQSVLSLCGEKKLAYELIARGILDLSRVPVEGLSGKQMIQIEASKSGKPHFDRPGIKNFLKLLKYPLYFLDFETMAPAIPVLDRTSPYQAIPFQYSLHVVEKEGDLSRQRREKPKHYSFLAEGRSDPRPKLLEDLKSKLGESGSIVAFNAPFESRVIRESAAAYPEFTNWADGISFRFVDLLSPFRAFLYYHPAQKGSASMKSVLPAMTGMNYSDLGIAEGGAASMEFVRVTFRDGIASEDRQSVREALLKYCELDTQGMVEIVKTLERDAA